MLFDLCGNKSSLIDHLIKRNAFVKTYFELVQEYKIPKVATWNRLLPLLNILLFYLGNQNNIWFACF